MGGDLHFFLPLFTSVYSSLATFTRVYVLTMFTRFYICLPQLTRSCLPVYPGLLMFTFFFKLVYLRISMFYHVYLSLLVFTEVYSCLPRFSTVLSSMFTFVYPRLLVFTYVYTC